MFVGTVTVLFLPGIILNRITGGRLEIWLCLILGWYTWTGLRPTWVLAVQWWALAAIMILWPDTKKGRARWHRVWCWLRGWKAGPTTIIDAITIKDMSFGPGGLEVRGAVDTATPERVRVRPGPMFGQPRPSAGAWRVRRTARG